MPILSGPVLEPQDSLKPSKLVIFCHGYGADGNDLIGLANYIQPVSYTHLTLPTTSSV